MNEGSNGCTGPTIGGITEVGGFVFLCFPASSKTDYGEDEPFFQATFTIHFNYLQLKPAFMLRPRLVTMVTR